MSIRARVISPLTVAVVAASGLVGIAASPSHAASADIFVSNGVLHYVGAPFSDDNQIVVFKNTNGAHRVLEQSANPGIDVTPGPGCVRIFGTKSVQCTGNITSVRVDLGPGNDSAQINTELPTTVLGGDDNDTYIGGTHRLVDDSHSVTFFGGPGMDTASYEFSTARVLVDIGTAKDEADDGRIVDTDNIASDVENLTGSTFSDSLRGNEGDNKIIGGRGADALRGGQGNDTIIAADGQIDTVDLSCGKGMDTITLDALDPAPSECEIVN
ncbi:hypothetical protein ACIRD2_34375 [Streptomyces sp. NPDC093595]|uniref:calcium-binding protein n=1 Tax=Streptomyces sp. NPDC093595 TaxID=3366045 RepID=UPI0038185604